HADRRVVVEEFLCAGFRAIIKVVDLARLDVSFLGRALDAQILNEFRNMGIDVCGENGEYHTLVIDGPLFREPFVVDKGQAVEENGYGILVTK
ncbi:MAG: ATP-binding protein, partial [Bacillota bacterium]